MVRLLRVLAAGLALAAAPPELRALCQPTGAPATVEAMVRKVENEGIKYLFVGERHAVGPVKRFIVDLANAFVDRGHDVGLYVEGFRTDCESSDVSCRDLARLFNPEAFSALAEQSRAPVHALDPPEKDRRATRMATTVAAGRESLRVVLVGNSHVLHAWQPDAEHWVYGGGVRYPNPGDVAEAFPRSESLTVTLEPGAQEGAPYSLVEDGCSSDYRVIAPYRSTY